MSQSSPLMPPQSFASATSNTHAIEVLKRAPECDCRDICVVRSVTRGGPNRGKLFWGCRNYKDAQDRGCGFFKLYDEEVVDERDLKICRQKRKIRLLKEERNLMKEEICLLRNQSGLLKHELRISKQCAKIFFVFGTVCFGTVVLLTMSMASGRGYSFQSMYLK